MLERADLDRDGGVDYGEFLAATLHLGRLERDERLYKAFRHFDQVLGLPRSTSAGLHLELSDWPNFAARTHSRAHSMLLGPLLRCRTTRGSSRGTSSLLGCAIWARCGVCVCG